MPTTLRIFVPAAILAIMDRLKQRLEVETGLRLIQAVELNPLILERIRAGEPYDIGLTNPSYANALIHEGLADGGSRTAPPLTAPSITFLGSTTAFPLPSWRR